MRRPPNLARAALIVGALGVVFGDIGTSPIYTIQTVFNPADPFPRGSNDRQRLRHDLDDLPIRA
jgi:K+ transporter